MLHDADSIAQREGFRTVVGNVDRRDPESSLKCAKLLAGFFTEPRVEIGKRFVQQQHGRLDHQRSSDRDALLLSPGEVSYGTPFHRCQLHKLQRVPNAATAFLFRNSASQKAELDVLVHSHVREERITLEYHPDIALFRALSGDVFLSEKHVAVLRLDEPGKKTQSGCFSAPGRPQKTEQLPGFHLEIQVRDSGFPVVPVTEIPQDDSHRHAA
ncbi:MAG: hypothetical protein BWY06_02899 [Candidatus Latescibacteria bacterium ADurb.Bin168]|nr:MAG: hypothetical protein BWY06_02899 [Candidatus Latescibacteria bacterium ADurb.Bin168]